MTTEESEHFNFTEEDCPYDCESCPYRLTAMECQELYEEFIETL
jgi:hypothetical protein